MKRAVFLVLAACADNRPVVEPIVDLPTNPDASAFPLDNLTMSIAHEGSLVDLASATFTHGQTVQLSGVPFADDLVVHLTGRVGTSEVAYGRTCSFAMSQGAPDPQPHLFFAREQKFSTLSVMPPEARIGGSAITYHDGSGVIVGGADPTNMLLPIADIERFDPRAGDLRLLATTTNPRLGAIAATLGTGSDAQIILIGGLDPTTGAGADFVELIEADSPSTQRIDVLPDANMSRIGLTATTLTDGRVIAIGGMSPPSGPTSPSVDEVTLVGGTAQVRPLQAMLAVPRYEHTATRLGDDVGAEVLVAGGLDATGTPIARAELYKPLNNTFSTAFMFGMQVPRWHHQAVRLPDGSVLIVGGFIDNPPSPMKPTPTNVLELFTQDAGFVKLTQTLPASAGLVDFTVTALPDGAVLLTGGLDAMNRPSNTATIVQLDPINGSVDVLATSNMSTARAGHQATVLCDGTVLLTGGTTAGEAAERYNPPAAGRR